MLNIFTFDITKLEKNLLKCITFVFIYLFIANFRIENVYSDKKAIFLIFISPREVTASHKT